MPAFLVKMFQAIATWLLTELIAKLRTWILEQKSKREREAAIKEALKPYLAGKTPEEQERAFQDLLSHMRG